MNTVRRITCGSICAAIMAAIPLAAQEKPAQSEILDLASDLVRADDFDQALAAVLEKLKTAPDSPDVAQAKATVAYYCLGGDKLETCVSLATEVTDRHASSPSASAAWLTLGVAYYRLRDEAKMVAALERGMELQRAEKGRAARFVSDTPYQLLGGHYIRTRQWDKALRVFEEWRPNSGCGNCHAAMEGERQLTLLICLIHANRHADAANAAWTSVMNPGFLAVSPSTHAAALAVIRLYEEAEQREDLMRLLDEIDPPLLVLNANQAIRVAAVAPDKKSEVERMVAEMRSALRLPGVASEQARISAFLGKGAGGRRTVSPLDQHVAGWLLSRDHRDGVSRIVPRARKAKHDPVNLAQLLVAIGTPAARNQLKAGTAVPLCPEVCQVILTHCPDAEEIIFGDRTPEAANRLAELEWSYGADFGHFYAVWPKPKAGSLPKKLPAELLAREKK